MAVMRCCRSDIEAVLKPRNAYATDGISIAAVPSQDAMATLHRVWIVTIGMLIVFALCEMWVQRSTVLSQHAIAFPPPHTTTSVLDIGAPASQQRDDDWAEPRVDLNGNEVDAAVGDYRVDRRGEMYERHAPDTALIHLTAPEL
jgi:hypothetical protein